MEKVRRARRGESAWRELVARQARSGLTVRVFCERERISAVSFYGWRARLQERAEGAPVVPGKQRPEGSAAGFIDLGELGNRARFQVRLELGDGVVLQLVRG